MASQKDREWSNHKYISRERDKRGKWRYYYDTDQKNRNLSKHAKDIAEGVVEIVDGYKDRFTKNRDVKASRGRKKIADSGRKFIEELLKPVV